MPRLYDVTLPVVPGMPGWPGDPPVSLSPWTRVTAGDAANVSSLTLGTHTGTHVDPPAHFLPGGVTADLLALEVLVGPAVVVALPGGGGPVEASDLASAGIGPDDVRVLCRTGGSGSLSAGAAGWLVEHGVLLVGVDALSVEAAGSPAYPVHRCLLGAGVVIVEGLDLTEVPPGRYDLICLPLKILGGDGAPARVVLRQR